jgi:hypothetical protein
MIVHLPKTIEPQPARRGGDYTDNTDEEMIHEELSGKSSGKRVCVREKLANTTRLIFMPEPYPCYPFNPWFS